MELKSMAEKRSHGRETQVSSLSRLGHSSRNPSFSSSLLDAVYRSIDLGEDEVVFYGQSAKAQKGCFYGGCGGGGGGFRGLEEEQRSLQRASIIEKWVEEKKIQGKFGEQRKSGVCHGGAAVSEEDVFQRPKPVRTTMEKSKSKNKGGDEIEAGEKKRGGGGGEARFSKTKSRAMKIYGELKKGKQPISPGGKLVGILNSLFAGNQKKPKTGADTNSGNTSTCSSASSFTRSITTNKTPSSAAGKRSVRFSAENEYIFKSPPHTTIRKAINLEVRIESTKVIPNSNEPHVKHIQNQVSDEEDDTASCASSDLFELENLPGIGITVPFHRHHQQEDELPVYETTNPHTNRAIAKGLIL